jgi:hypothetical protein
VLSQPLGAVLVGAAGALVAGYGLQQIYRGFTADIDDQLELGAMSATGARWAVAVARGGLVARGVVFGLIGVFLVVAGLQADPSEARGLGGALRTVEQQSFGPWLLSLVAIGLVA